MGIFLYVKCVPYTFHQEIDSSCIDISEDVEDVLEIEINPNQTCQVIIQIIDLVFTMTFYIFRLQNTRIMKFVTYPDSLDLYYDVTSKA